MAIKISQSEMEQKGSQTKDIDALMKLDFLKISYDRILTQNQKEYCVKHPEVDIHQAIDIIRDKADQDYLDQISNHCDSKVCNENEGE